MRARRLIVLLALVAAAFGAAGVSADPVVQMNDTRSNHIPPIGGGDRLCVEVGTDDLQVPSVCIPLP